MLDQKIVELAHRFRQDHRNFFHERELHAVFFSLCRERDVKVETQDGVPVHRFRHEYDSFWRYRRSRSDSYNQRYSDEGTTACFDFAFLNDNFVRNHSLLTVINKDELKRIAVREEIQSGAPHPVDAAVELKMAHFRSHDVVTHGAINRLGYGMAVDAVKIAVEGIQLGYVIGFSHGPDPSEEHATGIIKNCIEAHQDPTRANPLPVGNLRVVLITPKLTFLGGSWSEPADFPSPIRLVA
ncbi:MAG: hypothetical protein JSS27_15405 [Planctomycetes bacterium]|nr:hypothetical protein [Planctomycetota bacterium]